MKILVSIGLFIGLSCSLAMAQIGIFSTGEDIGDADAVFGFGGFDNDTYSLEAFTSDLDEVAPDNFYFVHSELSGSFSIQADPNVLEGRGGVMIRNNNSDSAAHGSLFMTNDLNVWPHTRFVDGGGTITDGDPEDDTTQTIRMVRAGNSVHYYRVNVDGSENLLQSEVIQFSSDSVLGGLAVGGNNALADFENVSINELPLNVMRVLPSTQYTPGMSMAGAQLVASVRGGAAVDASVLEIAPVGSAISNAQASAGDVAVNGNEISWTLSGQSANATLTYDITFPNRAVVTFPGTFTGTGIPVDSFIGGPSVLPNELPTFAGSPAPIEVDPFFPTTIQVEDGLPGTIQNGGFGEVDADAFGFGLDPRTTGITIIDTDGSSSHVIAIDINVSEAGTYYLFGLVRGEDGNSDSWHFEIDDLPSGGEDSRWNISGNKTYGTDWVEQEVPSNDPRPFELTAGTHTLYLANREDSASIDWLTITTNPSIDIATFDAFSRVTSISGRTLSDNFLSNGETTTEASVSIIYRDFDSSVMITETPPANFAVSNLTASAGTADQNADGTISWDISGLPQQGLTLSYTLSPPAVEGNTYRVATINGILNIEGQEPAELSGDTTIVLEGNPTASTGKVAFLFQNVGANEFSDVIMESHLRNQFGLDVQKKDDTDAAGFERPADLTGADVALVSGSVGSGNIGGMNYHLNAPESLITYESFLFDDYAFTSVFDFTTSLDMEIIDNTHPITQGLDLGLLRVFREEGGIAWADNPPEGVRILATPPGEPTHAALWVIEPGTTVAGNNIPGIRLGLWSGTFANFSNAGIDLMNRIIAYGLGGEPPAPPTAVNDYMLYE